MIPQSSNIGSTEIRWWACYSKNDKWVGSVWWQNAWEGVEVVWGGGAYFMVSGVTSVDCAVFVHARMDDCCWH